MTHFTGAEVQVEFTEPPADYTSIDVTFSTTCGAPAELIGDSSVWEFSHTTVQRDITAYELALILRLQLTVADGMVGALKAECPEAMRHFARKGVGFTR